MGITYLYLYHYLYFNINKFKQVCRNTLVLDRLSYFLYVLRFGLISLQRACVIQRFYVCFSLGFFFCFYLFCFYEFFQCW
ncbi:hypothetical protein Hanom_Chr16g01459021 [Helianthus anomalus]